MTPEQRATYSRLLKTMTVRPSHAARIEAAAKRILRAKARYVAIEAETGVPWGLIGVLHMRESSNSFAGVLHNGEKIIGTGRRTTLVPAGRGPFSSWEEAAVDALRIKGLHKLTRADWTLERMAYEAERFNGFGYRNRGRISPYLWAGTSHYSRGKYVRDGVFDPNHVDAQLGVIPVLLRVYTLDGEPSPQDIPISQKPPLRLSSFLRLQMWLKSLVVTLTGLFTIDNAGVAQEWLSLGDVSRYLLFLAAFLFIAWLLLEWLKTAALREPIEKDTDDVDS